MTNFRSAVSRTLIFAALLLVTACMTPQQRGPGALVTRAQLHITNLTPYAWSVVALRDGRPLQSIRVDKFATTALVFDGGDYQIEQTLLDAPLATAAARRFDVRFEPGESYQWSLATLQSAAEDAR